MRTLFLAILLLVPSVVAAQTGSAYGDPVARELVAKARASRGELGRSISSYTAVVRRRSAAMLRMPLRDRLLDREESASRVRWSRDGETVVQVLARRDEDRGLDIDPRDLDDMGDELFDPAGDRVYFAMAGMGGGDDDDDDDGLWTAHPLAEGSEEFYRYESGDTMTVRLSGRTIRAVQLNVIPRVSSFHYFAATLWIEPETGALVQAVYRPSRVLDILSDTSIIEPDDREGLWVIPGLFKPFELDFESIIVQYSLWDLKHWLPRISRIEGYFRAGAVRIPFSDETSYAIEAVTDDADGPPPAVSPEQLVASWGGSGPMQDVTAERDSADHRPRARIYAPEDLSLLARSELLPPPIWEDAPEFATEGEIDDLVDSLERAVNRARLAGMMEKEVHWGGGAGDLLRYNRVEGLSVGARGIARHPLGTTQATVRVGTADLTPNVELAATHPRWGRTLGASVYHQLAAVDPAAMSLGNSAAALLFGRDAGEYYRATGARFDITPAATERPWYRWSLFAERQRPVERGTRWSAARFLGSDRDFRPNLAADPADLVGASLSLTPWWGSDPLSPQAGLEYYLEGATGDRAFSRSRLVARTLIPVGTRHRVGLEAGGGTSWGDLPAQANWFLGGSGTLRGYDPSTLVGSSFLRGRAGITRGSTAAGVTLFTDAGWAGDRSAFDADDVLLSVGAGATVLDGLLRLDLSRALREPIDWKLDFYLDSII